MAESPTIWHYGLMAERWAKVLKETPELKFLTHRINAYGEPVLDVACGTGRLLLPLAQAGFDIDGLEFSIDMLAHCRRLAGDAGLSPQLFQQSMAEIELPRQYRLIYIIGSFGLAGSRQKDLETLHGCYQCLMPGGALVFNIQAEYTDSDSWASWSTEKLSELPEEWPEEPRDRQGEDGTIHRAYFRLMDLDPLDQRYTREVRLEKWVQGKMVASEQYALSGMMYLASEVRLMLNTAGFNEVLLSGDFTDQPATAADMELVFTAVK